MMPELLAPAGNMDALIAAVNAGCDAVYLGMNKFGARAYAENFDFDNLGEAINYCHMHNVMVYVTMNTIIFEEELSLAYAQIDKLYELGVDAIIIQDIALIDYVKNHCPNMEAHASTQMGLDDVNGVLFAKSLGINRAVLGRECNYQKAKEIKKITKMPIELFVHGALCVSYSGNCLMSGLIGYRSGNRGRCVGSCRKPYELIDVTNHKSLGTSYILSMKDLQTIENIHDLDFADSLKIEGRMKEASYVYNVVKNYRLALDNKEYDLLDLKKTFNRTYTKGYLFNEDRKDIINVSKPNHHGYQIGKINKINGKQIEIKLHKPLHQNDVIRIDAKEEVNYPVVKLYDGKGNLINCADQVCYIYLDEKVSIGDKVFITKDTLFLDGLEKELKNKYRRIPLNFFINATVGYPLILTVTTEDGCVASVKSDFNLEIANNKLLDDAFFIKQLSRLNDTPYRLDSFEFSGDNNAFVPASVLNELRRKVINSLNEIRLYRSNIKVNYSLDNAYLEQLSERGLSAFCTTKEQYEACCEAGIDTIYFNNFIRRNDTNYEIEDNLILAGGYGGLYHYQNKDNYLVSDFSLNVVNSRAVYLLHQAGVKRVTISHEMNKKDINDLINEFENNYQGKPNLEMIVYGRAHLLHTKYCPLKVNGLCGLCKKNQYVIKDEYGEFPIISNHDCSTTIVNGKILNLLDDLDSIPDAVRKLRLQFTTESKEEVLEIIKIAVEKLDGNSLKTFDKDIHTRGHFNREII